MIDPEKVAHHLDLLAKPKGSLGRLEELAIRLGACQGTLRPETKPRRLLVFAGDHGVVTDGVGIWPQAVTGAMIRLIASGRASCSALAAQFDASVVLIDVGSMIEAAPDGASTRHEPGAILARVDGGSGRGFRSTGRWRPRACRR